MTTTHHVEAAAALGNVGRPRRSGPPRSAPGLRRLLGNTLLPASLIIVVLLTWAVSVRVFAIPSYLLPGPDEVLAKITQEWRLFLTHGAATLGVILSGFMVSVVVGVSLALAVVLNRARRAHDHAARRWFPNHPESRHRTPLRRLAFGFRMQPKIAITFLISFFPVVIATVAGLKAVESDMLDLVSFDGRERR